MNAPQPGDYAPFAESYVKLAAVYPDVIALLKNLKDSTYETFTALSEEQGHYAYAEDKWTIKEMLGHMIDTERVFSYRLYCISRGDKTPLPGFEQNDYVANNNFNSRTLKNIADEFKALRESNLYFINNLTDNQLTERGTASNHPVTANALLYMMAGHELYHLNLLRDRYLQLRSNRSEAEGVKSLI